MKSNLLFILHTLALSALVADASFSRRRPHDNIVHRRDFGGGDILHDFENDMSSLFGGFTQDPGASSTSSSTSLSPSSSFSSASVSTNTRTRAAEVSSSTPDASSSASSSNGFNLGHGLSSWLNGIFGGQSNPTTVTYMTNPRDGRLLGGKPKMGLAWPNGGSMNITRFLNSKISWFYSWDSVPGFSPIPDNVTFCPMLWGSSKAGKFKRHVTDNPESHTNSGKCVMAMNEVNQQGQAKMSEGTACSLMREYILPLKDHDYYVVSPVTTNAPSGKKWMQNFRESCSDVWDNINAVAVHFYGTNTTEFKDYVVDWHQTFNKPVWVTEYACQNFNGGDQCSDSKVFNFHMEMSVWFDEQDFVEAYAPFGVMQNMQDVNTANQLVENGNPNLMFNTLSGLP